jgi:hypothetical protein
LDPAQLASVQDPDSFEKIIKRWSKDFDNGKVNAGLRGSLFLKGKVKGEYLLTLAYDSDRDLSARMFRDISPDEYYPVYGDSSERGWDAQSTPRKEADKVEFLSGIFEGKSTGCPIGFIVWNENQHPNDYNNLKNVYRPSHADYTYTVKYGIRDHRGGGTDGRFNSIGKEGP